MKNENIEKTIQKTLMTARLFDGYWDRWIVHGIDFSDVQLVKSSLISDKRWSESFGKLGEKYYEQANQLESDGMIKQAEDTYRKAALYYNLVHWIYPERTTEKINWYKKVHEIVAKADSLASISCRIESFTIDRIACAGRVRELENPKGCIIIINPIDSTKEELYSYEKHFIESGFNTVSFDGPGQGETYTFNGLKVTKKRWEDFIHQVIEWTAQHFPNQPIYLFGTSSGASWSIYGSTHPKVEKVAAVSPAVTGGTTIPGYFGERIQFISEKDSSTHIIPILNDVTQYLSILLFHGNKDVMVHDRDMHLFYDSLSSPKKLVEFEEEGHCCNYKLEEVRDISMEWFVHERG